MLKTKHYMLKWPALSRLTLSLLALSIVVGASGCSQKTTRLDLYWPHDLWDGMNRMVFALEELGYELYSVDTDDGTIMARHWPTEDERAQLTGFDSRRPLQLWIHFPYDADSPIVIKEILPESGIRGLSEKNLQERINTIAEKFQQFGGVVVEVKAAE
jgi:hypothetical protein